MIKKTINNLFMVVLMIAGIYFCCQMQEHFISDNGYVWTLGLAYAVMLFAVFAVFILIDLALCLIGIGVKWIVKAVTK